MLKIFAPPPHKEEIKDHKEVSEKYSYWRIRIFYSMFIGYALFYFTRYSFTFTKPILAEQYGYSLMQLGLIQTLFAFVYGASKFASGIFSDRSNPRYVMGIGLIMTGVFNIFFGFSTSIWFFAIFWMFNSLFQGCGWPASGRLIMNWYSKSERGRWWGSWNISHNVGGLIIPMLASFVAALWGWRYALHIPGIICIFGGFFLINRLRDTPQSLGLPNVQKFRNDESDHQKGQEEEISLKDRLFKFVLNNKYIWILAITYFCIYLMKDAVGRWHHVFLVQTKGFSTKMFLIGCASISAFELGGLFGSLTAGWLSDCVFKGRRGPTNIMFMIGIVFSLIGLRLFSGGSPYSAAFWMLLCGFFIYGPQMLFGIVATEFAHKKAVGTVTGFIGFFAYIGTASAGLPLMWLASRFGWDLFFKVIIVTSFVTILLYLPVVFAERRRINKEKELLNLSTS